MKCSAMLLWIIVSGMTVPTSTAQLIPVDQLSSFHVYKDIESALISPDSVFRLDLSKKRLKAFPVEVFQFKNLNELRLDKNRLKNIPTEIGQLNYLQLLSLSNNKIDSFSLGILQLTHLRKLDLGNNEVTVIPKGIERLTALQQLILWDNPIEIYPSLLGELKHLEILDLLHNQMSSDTQERLKKLLPHTTLFFSPPCRCEDAEE